MQIHSWTFTSVPLRLVYKNIYLNILKPKQCLSEFAKPIFNQNMLFDKSVYMYILQKV